MNPTETPTHAPTAIPTSTPTTAPTFAPTVAPTTAPVSHDRTALDNSFAAVAYDTADCMGRSIKLSSVHSNVLCGTHFQDSGGKGSCYCSWEETCGTKHTTCANDMIRSIFLPPMTSAKLYKHCNNNFEGGSNKRYESLSNKGTVGKCFDLIRHLNSLETYDTSNIVIEGDVIKVEADIVGSGADCYESQCKTYADACHADAWCSELLTEVEQVVAKGDDFLFAMKAHAYSANQPFQDLYTCAGLSNANCLPGPNSVSFTPTGSTTYPSTAGHTPGEDESEDEIVPEVISCNFPIMPVAIGSMDATSYNNNGNNGADGSAATAGGDGDDYEDDMNGFASTIFAGGAGGTFFERRGRRLASAAGSTTAFIQIKTNGNQNSVGSASNSIASSSEFSSDASSSSRAYEADGITADKISSSTTFALAFGGCAIAALAVALVVNKQQQTGVSKPAHVANPLSKSDGLSSTNEELTDVL
jgi:hypothetical protein